VRISVSLLNFVLLTSFHFFSKYKQKRKKLKAQKPVSKFGIVTKVGQHDNYCDSDDEGVLGLESAESQGRKPAAVAAAATTAAVSAAATTANKRKSHGSKPAATNTNNKRMTRGDRKRKNEEGASV
jgi:peptidoglycan hydrolase CwlO-like protein